MTQKDSADSIIRFDAFEADMRSGELRKQGLKLRIGDQPFSVLTVLLAQPGEVVTREELQNRLWPADTFVDFERGLNKAINRLREALGTPLIHRASLKRCPSAGIGSSELLVRQQPLARASRFSRMPSCDGRNARTRGLDPMRSGPLRWRSVWWSQRGRWYPTDEDRLQLDQ